jgi:hypothetical protein
MCCTERVALQLFLLVLNLLCVVETEQHYSCLYYYWICCWGHRQNNTAAVCVSVEFVMCGTERVEMQLFLLALSFLCVAQTEQHCSFFITNELLLCGTDREALQPFLWVLNLLCLAQTEQHYRRLLVLNFLRVTQTEQHYSCCISDEFLTCGKNRTELQMFVLVLNLFCASQKEQH